MASQQTRPNGFLVRFSVGFTLFVLLSAGSQRMLHRWPEYRPHYYLTSAILIAVLTARLIAECIRRRRK